MPSQRNQIDGVRVRATDVPDDIVQELLASVEQAKSVERPPVVEPMARLMPSPVHPLDSYAQQRVPPSMVLTAPRARGQSFFSLIPWLLGAGAVIAGLLFVSQYGVKIKGRVVQQGNAAIGHLMTAKDDLQSFDFDGAQASLERSSAEFADASKELNALGPSFINIISKIPGLSSLKTGQDILRVGALLSDAGLALSEAVKVTTVSGGLLDTHATDRTSLGSIFLPLQQALSRAQGDVTEASSLMKRIDGGSLPEQYREQFVSLQERLPVIQSMVGRAVDATSFVGRLMGTDRPRRYIVLFTNSSELRPTGGFPGSYGILTFENGRVKDFRADDIYNPDGQIKEVIVPPLQLQHITPGWGMRDVAWWIDFPTSARKVMQYWQKGGNAAVDGVLAIKPDVLAGILKITGPISMPQYDTVLTSDNVLATLQLEVESKKTAQPKQIIVDLAPLILQRLSSAPASQWVALLGLFTQSLSRKDALMYFDDEQLQKYIVAQGFAGNVQETTGDYLSVNVSNIKGAKSDAVTDSSVKLESWMQDGTMMHRLTLTRRHNGGSTEYGFYNKPNYSWVRVLVPEGSVLRGISGNDTPGYRPLLDYTKASVVRDSDLQALEATYQTSGMGAVTYREAGKTGFGFWMTTDPGETSAVQLEYAVPAKNVSDDYSLLVQRQPGLVLSDFEFTVQKNASVTVGSSQPSMTEWPDSWRLHDKLLQDLRISVGLK